MEVVPGTTLLPGDPRLIDHIVCELKSQGIFDQFRKECIADVDTKPAYQNLRQRVEGSVTGFLKNQVWRSDMNKNQLREMLRKNIYESGFLETGVERIVDQVVNPKINTVFLPQVEDVVYKFLGLQKPNRLNNFRNGPLSINTVDLLPTDLDPISPDSEVLDKTLNKSNDTEKHDDSKQEEFESPPFEPLNEQSVFSQQDESSNDSHLSGISGLTSHDSNHSTTSQTKPPETANQDSQLSKVSSNSHLSIVTGEDKISSEKMDISDDTQNSKNDTNSKNSSNSDNGYSNFNIKEQMDTITSEKLDKDTTEVEMDTSDSQDKMETDSKLETHDLEDQLRNLESNDSKPQDTDSKIDVSKPEEPKTFSTDSKIRDSDLKVLDSDSKDSKSRDLDSKSRDSDSRSDSKNRDSDSKTSKYDTKKSDSDSKDSKSESKHRDTEKSDSRSRDSDKYRSKHSSRSEKKSDSDKNRSDRKDSKSHSSSSKDKYRDKSRDSKNDSKSDSKSKSRDDSKTNRDDSKSKSSSSKHSSRDKERSSVKSDRKDSSSRDKDRSKSRSDSKKSDDAKKHDDSKKYDDSKKSEEHKKSESSKSDSKSSDRRSSNGESKSRSESKSSRDRKSSSSSHKKDSSHSKDSKKSSKKDKDDHFSSKDKKTDTRRSTDRDSNDGNSGLGAISNLKESNNASKNKTSESSFSGSNSGESGQSDKTEPIDTNQTDNLNSLDLKHTTSYEPVKIKKPKFASNIFEARRLMKVRKKLEKMEKRRQKELFNLVQNENEMIKNDQEEPMKNKTEEMVTIVEIKGNEDDGYHENEEKPSDSNPPDISIPEEVSTLKPSSVVSKASWDEIEARMMNVNYNSYIDENADSCSSSKSAKGVIKEHGKQEENELEEVEKEEQEESVLKKNSTDEEDCLYFNPEISPTTERYLKKIDDYQKTSSQVVMILETNLSMAPPNNIGKINRRSRKLNTKYSSNNHETEHIEEDNRINNTEGKTDRKRRGPKRRIEAEGTEEMDTDNNNKKIHVLEDVSNTDVGDEFAGFGATSNNHESPSKLRCNKSKRNKKNEHVSSDDSFSMPLSPDSDVSANSIELRIRKNEEREAIIQQLTQPIKNRGSALASQRYSSDDLYKPRPLFTGSRRTRGLINNADKNTEDTTSKRR